MAKVFFLDSNVVLYALLDGGSKADRAEELLREDPQISVQVLNEVSNVLRRKNKQRWPEIDFAIDAIKRICTIHPLTVATHDQGRAAAARYGFAIYDAMIVGSALAAGCDTLYSEDLQAGLEIYGQLRIVNPFVQEGTGIKKIRRRLAIPCKQSP